MEKITKEDLGYDKLDEATKAKLDAIFKAQEDMEAELSAEKTKNAEAVKKQEELETKLLQESEEKEKASFIQKAEELDKLPVKADEFGLILKEASKTMSKESFEKLFETLKASNEAIKKGELFSEKGSEKNNTSDAWEKIEKMAKTMVAKSEGMTLAKATDLVLKTDEGKKLYNEYLNEGGR